MRPKISPRKKNNLLIPERTVKTFYINKNDPTTKGYYKLFENLYEKSGKLMTEKITLRTYLKIDQNLYKPSEEVSQNSKWISHQVHIKSMNGSEESYEIKKALEGFPIDL